MNRSVRMLRLFNTSDIILIERKKREEKERKKERKEERRYFAYCLLQSYGRKDEIKEGVEKRKISYFVLARYLIQH